MTAEERACWERRRYEARLVLNEIAPTRKKLKELSEAYDRIFCRQFIKFSEADERLAYEDGRHKVIKQTRDTRSQRSASDYSAEELLRSMNKEQILRMQAALAEMRRKDGKESVPADAPQS